MTLGAARGEDLLADGNVGLGTAAPQNQLPGAATSDPIRLDGLTPTRFAVTDDWLYFATGDTAKGLQALTGNVAEKASPLVCVSATGPKRRCRMTSFPSSTLRS